MTLASHSRAAQLAYQDLLRLHLEEPTSALIGSVEERVRNGRSYLYDKFRIGTEMKSRYLGEGTPELRDRLAQAAELNVQATVRRQTMVRLARVLRAEGLIGTGRDGGSLLLAFARAGVFRMGGTLVGTAAYALYQGELGLRCVSEDLPLTAGGDLASFKRLSIVLGERLEEDPGDILQMLKFDLMPDVQNRLVWKWRQNRGEALVEFLAPALGGESITQLPALGVSVQRINHLNFLISQPVPAVALYRAGVLVQIPRPERYAISKLIVADRRHALSDLAKAQKDREQAASLIASLAPARPDVLRHAFEDAVALVPSWGDAIKASLASMPKTAAILRDIL